MEETKIITNGFPENNQILLEKSTLVYVQNPDCTEDQEGDWQRLVISTRNNGVSNFINISTENWSIDDESNLVMIINDFKNRIGYDER